MKELQRELDENAAAEEHLHAALLRPRQELEEGQRSPGPLSLPRKWVQLSNKVLERQEQ